MTEERKDNIQFLIVILGMTALAIGATLDIISMMFGTK
jgi:hypothetical protein